MRSFPCSALLFACSLPLGACGGSGGGGSPVTVVLESVAAIDGTVGSDGVVSTFGVALRVGDEDSDQNGSTVASFVSFDLTALPAGGAVTQAVFSIRRNNNVGNPMVGHGEVTLDDVNLGATLDAADPTQVFASALGEIDDATSGIDLTLDVTARVQAALAAGRPRFQLRLRYTIPSNGDGVSDWTNYISSDSGNPTLRPKLVVTRLP